MPKNKKSLLVTGGLGFIGSHLVKRLKDYLKIIVIDNDKSQSAIELIKKWTKIGIIIHQNDIGESESWDNLEGCDFIFHGAAQTSAEESKKKEIVLQDFNTNLRGTFLLAEYARKYHAKIIYCNTIRAYAPEFVDAAKKSNTLIDENFPTIDKSKVTQPPFAASKYFGEQYLKFYSQFHGLQVISHRMSGIMGPGQIGKQIHGWVSYIVKCAVREKPYTIFGDGHQSRDILHINDLVDLIEMELNDFERFCDQGFVVYNIGGGPKNEISINEIIELLKREYRLVLNSTPGHPREGEPKHYVSCLNKIAKKGWPAGNKLISKTKIIDELIRWYQGEN